MTKRLVNRVQAQHPDLEVSSCIRASSNPWWLTIAATVGFATVSFVLRVRGVPFDQSLVCAFPAFVVTYLLVVRRFYVVGTRTDIHLVPRGPKRLMSSVDSGPVEIDDIDMIEESMIVDRWYLGERELAILKRNRRHLTSMVKHITAELSMQAQRDLLET